MNTHLHFSTNRLTPKNKSMNTFLLLALSLAFLSVTVFSNTLSAQEQYARDNSSVPDSLSTQDMISEAELAQVLAPIALYPDTLLTHILIASTYPLEVIEAERWLTQHSTLTSEQLQQETEQKPWDASIKALLAFPNVIGKLSEDLNWMQTLGTAFLQEEARVLASIQTLRQQAEQAGSLANMDNVQVIREQKVIIIEPAQPTVIYVPVYDTRTVYGRWHWSRYPPIYWHSPYLYASAYSPFYWGHGIHIRSHFFFSAFHWSNRHVVVRHHSRYGYHSRKKIVTSHQAKRWNHQPKHRRGVSYRSAGLNKKYYGTQSTPHNAKRYASHKTASKSNRHSTSTNVMHKNKAYRISNNHSSQKEHKGTNNQRYNNTYKSQKRESNKADKSNKPHYLANNSANANHRGDKQAYVNQQLQDNKRNKMIKGSQYNDHYPQKVRKNNSSQQGYELANQYSTKANSSNRETRNQSKNKYNTQYKAPSNKQGTHSKSASKSSTKQQSTRQSSGNRTQSNHSRSNQSKRSHHKAKPREK